LSPAKAAGKIIVCDRGAIPRTDKSAEVARVGGVGMVLTNTTESSLDADVHFVPTVHVDEVAGAAIKRYVTSATNPTASIELGDTTGGRPRRSRRAPGSRRAVLRSRTPRTCSSRTSRLRE
jgi:hypothetical protein